MAFYYDSCKIKRFHLVLDEELYTKISSYIIKNKIDFSWFINLLFKNLKKYIELNVFSSESFNLNNKISSNLNLTVKKMNKHLYLSLKEDVYNKLLFIQASYRLNSKAFVLREIIKKYFDLLDILGEDGLWENEMICWDLLMENPDINKIESEKKDKRIEDNLENYNKWCALMRFDDKAHMCNITKKYYAIVYYNFKFEPQKTIIYPKNGIEKPRYYYKMFMKRIKDYYELKNNNYNDYCI